VERTEIACCCLFKAHGQGSKAFELVEEDLNQIALGVSLPVQARLALSRGVRANDSLHAALSDRAANRVGVVASVRYRCFAFRMPEELFGDCGFVLLSGRDLDVERAPCRIDERVDLRRESTT